MGALFQNVLEASFHGGIVIVVVLLARLVLRKAPKKYICLLWLLAALRLLLPIEIESRLSLQPELNPVVQSGDAFVPEEHPEVPAVTYPASPAMPDSQEFPDDVVIVTTPNAVEKEEIRAVDYTEIFSRVWLSVAAGMLVYSALSYLRLRRRVGDGVILSEGIWVSGRIDSPFVMGFFRPRIYLTPGLGEKEREYVLAHEKCHIRRGDQWWKLLGYITLAVHWFHPLVWLGYVLLCRDLEMACDEAVVKEMAVAERKAYSAALLACSARGHTIAACPVAFGEVSVKERIRNVLNYRKPKFWIVLIALTAIVVVAVCFLTTPPEPEVPKDGNVPVPQVESVRRWGITAWCKNPSATGVEFVFEQTDPSIKGELLYGQAYTLEKWDGTQWVAVSPIIENGAFTMEAILLQKNTATVLEIDWEWLYGEVNDGYYRITKTVGLGSESQDFPVCFGIGEGYENMSANQTEEALQETTIAAVSGRTFTYEKPGIMGAFTISIYADGTFTYYEGMASSYIGIGTWSVEGNILTLTDTGLGSLTRCFRFRVKDDGLYFMEAASDRFIYVDVADGDRFAVSVQTVEVDLSPEQVTAMCAAAYGELHNAGCYYIHIDADYGVDSYQWKNGDSYYVHIIDSGWYDYLVHGEVYYRISPEMAQREGIPMGWIDQDYVEENRIGYLGSLGNIYFWELWSWEEWAPEFKRWEPILDGMICEFTDREDPDTSWLLALDAVGNLTYIEKIMSGSTVEVCTILSLDPAYAANGIALEYADAYRSVPNAVIVRDQAFYEELFTRQTDGAYATMWVGDLYEAFYAEPEEFTRQLSRKFGEDPGKVREALTLMSYELEWYEPERFIQTLEELRNVADLDQNAVDLLYWYYWEGEYRALGGGHCVNVPDNGQDYLAAALEGCEILEGYHLQVSSGSMFRYTYVSCRVEDDPYITELYQGQGTFDENTYAFNLYVTFVPENDGAYAYSMAGNTGEYSGSDPEVPEGALEYSRCGYVTRTENGWLVEITGTGW